MAVNIKYTLTSLLYFLLNNRPPTARPVSFKYQQIKTYKPLNIEDVNQKVIKQQEYERRAEVKQVRQTRALKGIICQRTCRGGKVHEAPF